MPDAMLLGHWYLTQPGLPRRHLNDLVNALGWSGRSGGQRPAAYRDGVEVLNGSIDDQWNGTLGWMWVACVVTTIPGWSADQAGAT